MPRGGSLVAVEDDVVIGIVPGEEGVGIGRRVSGLGASP